MKKFLIVSSELLSFILAGLFVGWFLDKSFNLGGWAILSCVIVVYILWFIKFYKRFH